VEPEEELAARVLEQRATVLQLVQVKTRRHLALVRDWIDGHELFEWVEPTAGVVGCPRIRPEIDVDIDGFYRALLDERGTYVGPGRWFDQDPASFASGLPGRLKMSSNVGSRGWIWRQREPVGLLTI
jgi:aspartate/methionine/tyrosine aminotransferase